RERGGGPWGGSDGAFFPDHGHRAAPEGEPAQVFHPATARPAGHPVAAPPGDGAAAAGGIRAAGGGGAGVERRRRSERDPAAGRQLALGGGDDARLPRRTAALAEGLPHRLPALVEAGDRPG